MTLSIEMNAELFRLFNGISVKSGKPLGKVLRDSLVLYSLAVEAARTGGYMAINEHRVKA